MDQDSICLLIRRKLAAGDLPHDSIPRFWGDPPDGERVRRMRATHPSPTRWSWKAAARPPTRGFSCTSSVSPSGTRRGMRLAGHQWRQGSRWTDACEMRPSARLGDGAGRRPDVFTDAVLRHGIARVEVVHRGALHGPQHPRALGGGGGGEGEEAERGDQGAGGDGGDHDSSAMPTHTGVVPLSRIRRGNLQRLRNAMGSSWSSRNSQRK